MRGSIVNLKQLRWGKFDSNGDDNVSPVDALLVVNLLYRRDLSPLLTAGVDSDLDVSSDGPPTVIDAVG